MALSLNEFFKKSLSLIDEQDIDREINETQLKQGTTLLKKDLDILDMENQVNSIKRRTEEIKNKNKTLCDQLESAKKSLED